MNVKIPYNKMANCPAEARKLCDVASVAGCKEFLCEDRTKCIKADKVCDVTHDCDDGSDQVDCGVLDTCRHISCNTGEKESNS